jgi:hypothetical protein
MPRLSTIEIIKLIGAINDLTVLNWKRRFYPDERIQFPKSPELPQLKDRQKALQVIHEIIHLSWYPEYRNSLLSEMEKDEDAEEI